jgi:transaldolase / glucose-6-phosphate isomerase
MSVLTKLTDLGQSIWYDNIRRALLDSGELADLLDRYAITGVTSNPTIFENAIAGGSDYDEGVLHALGEGIEDPEELFWWLAIRDIQETADLLAEIHERTDGADGFVSLELPPRLADDTDGSVAFAVELAQRVDRPNLMVKVPGTPAGVAALEELIVQGVNVNVTLLFSLPQWEATTDAYIRGLERRLAEGKDLDVASVASFFVSRIDGLANPRLPGHLHNRLAVANAQLSYTAYRSSLETERWRRLAAAGARPQRLLWASTSVKDPRLDDSYYVRELAAAGTVNTMPEHTLFAFAKEGTLDGPLGTDPSAANEVATAAAAAGVELAPLGRELQEQGRGAFATSFDNLLACISTKATTIRAGAEATVAQLGPIADEVAEAEADLQRRDAVTRLWRRDHTLWQDDPTEVADRLGWLTSPAELADDVDELQRFTKHARSDGFRHALVLGMGGSSLFPLVASRTLAGPGEGLDLHVLDSIDPATIRRVTGALPADETLIIASSKSGTTAETRSLLEWFWTRAPVQERYVVISDPDTPLAALGRERGFRQVFENRADIGGRYSALSHFGLVPAALAGADVAELLRRAGWMLAACADCVPQASHPGLQLAAILAGARHAGRDKLTLVVDPALDGFGLWLEQLIAESTGKGGTGIVPIVGEPAGDPSVYDDDRLFVSIGGPADALDALAAAGHPTYHLPVAGPLGLGAEVLRWEIAIALTGAALGINPFDQPDVEAAKDASRRALDEGVREPASQALEPLLEQLRPGDYLAIQAYLDPADPAVDELERARTVLRDRHRVATTLGIGPRYLHSTGQLHKGGANRGVFVQVVADDLDDPAIPGERFGFATLKRAQAAGDLATLLDRGRRAARVSLEDLRAVGR